MKKVILGIIVLLVAGFTLTESPESSASKLRNQFTGINTVKVTKNKNLALNWWKWLGSHVTQNLAVDRDKEADVLLAGSLSLPLPPSEVAENPVSEVQPVAPVIRKGHRITL
jgi:hypothetical protein